MCEGLQAGNIATGHTQTKGVHPHRFFFRITYYILLRLLPIDIVLLLFLPPFWAEKHISGECCLSDYSL